ncbi:MAG: SEL1-like repeat protein [Acidobacteriaceae bacterium]
MPSHLPCALPARRFAPAHRTTRALLKSSVPFACMLLTAAAQAQATAPPLGAPPANVPQDPTLPGPSAMGTEQELRLANACLTGKGVAKDPATAAIWFRKAADAGDPTAQNNLGYLYLTGMGVARDEAEAARWFARALAGGSEEGKFNLALLCLKGPDSVRNISMALDLLNQLARKENARAEDSLGVIYLTGEGVPRDPVTAETWFTRSAKHGDAHSQYALGILNSIESGHEHNLSKAADYLRRAAHGGYVRAMYILGLLLVKNSDLSPKYPNEGVEMLTDAADAGEWEASAILGMLARDGRGMPQDPATAFRWFLIEAKQGGAAAEQKARQDIANCRKALTPEQQDRELRSADQWLAQHRDSSVYVFRNGLTVAEDAVFLARPSGME